MKGPLRSFKTFLFYGMWTVLSGCTAVMTPTAEMSQRTTAIDGGELDFKIDTASPLGFIEESGADPAAVGIQEYGLTTEVRQNITFDGTKNSGLKNIFLDTATEIVWFAQFSIAGSLKNNISRSYRIQWISPNQTLFQENRFKASFWNETFVKTTLKLKQPLPKNLIGRWRVRVWKKNLLIDDRYFEIVSTR